MYVCECVCVSDVDASSTAGGKTVWRCPHPARHADEPVFTDSLTWNVRALTADGLRIASDPFSSSVLTTRLSAMFEYPVKESNQKRFFNSFLSFGLTKTLAPTLYNKTYNHPT